MDILKNLLPSLGPTKHLEISRLLVAILLLASAFVTFSSTANAQTVSVIEIDGDVLDHNRTQGSRWKRVDFNPLIDGTHFIRVAWDSDADIRFNLFETNGTRISSVIRGSNPAVWSGELDANAQYYMGVWSASGVATYTASIEAESIDTTPLEITTQPTDLAVTEGDDATFTVAASGSGTLSYQWFLNNTAIIGAINKTLTVTPTSLANDGNVYRVNITNDHSSISSQVATLTVLEAVLPASVTRFGEGTLDFNRIHGPRSVRLNFDSLASALHTINVSWDSDSDVRYNVFDANGNRINSSVIRGSNPGVWAGELESNRQYYIRAWTRGGIAHYTANVEARVPFSLESQPSDLIVTEGGNATFVVEATGSGSFSYQWFADGVPIVGETGDSLTVFSTILAENGTEYTVGVSNGFDTITSDAATLTVNETLVLGLFSQKADTASWVLDGPAPTLDFNRTEENDGWGRVLLRIDDVLLVGGDFDGLQPTRFGAFTSRPFLAALDAVSGQPITSFQVPPQVNSVVRALVLSPSGDQVYVGGDFGLLALDANTGELDFAISVTEGTTGGRVFDIAVTDTQMYIGGDFSHVAGTFRANIARLSLNGVLDSSWSPQATNGFESGRAAPVQSITLSTSGDVVYVGGTFGFIDDTPVETTPHGSTISLLTLNASDATVRPERFFPDVGNVTKAPTVHDLAVTDDYVIIAWGGPNLLTFHSLAGDRLRQYRGKGDVQALQVVGNHVFVGHHGEFFGFLPNPIPQEALGSLNPEVIVPYKFHSFRIDGGSFEPEQAWKLTGRFGVWGIAAAEDSIWIAGQISVAGSNDRPVDGLVKFPALD